MALAFGVPLAAQSSDTLAQRAATLEQGAQNVTALRDVRRLHIAYTQFAEFGLWQAMAELFADDAMIVVGERTISGKAAILRWLRDELGTGSEGLPPGAVRTLLPFSPVANLSPDGRTAEVRWHELGLLGDAAKGARWTGGIYENDYVRDGAVWKIARMHYFPQFAGSYEDGWRNVEADLKVVPMHYTPDTAGTPIPAMVPPPPVEQPEVTGAEAIGALALQLEEKAVRNLQNIYGYYVDRRMWDDVADLFGDDATLDIAGLGQWKGRQSIRRSLDREGPAGLGAGELNEHVQFPAMITVSPNGAEAFARGLELAMTGKNFDKGYWAVSVFENRYVKHDGAWRIADMRLFPRFRADYSEGWSRSRLDPIAPAEAQAPDRRSRFRKDAVPAFSYLHPVTGEKVQLPSALPAAGDTPPMAQARPSPAGPGAVAEGERLLRLLAADAGAENVSNAFGNYIDDFEWEQLGQLFARRGAREMPFAGFYIGPERITQAEVTKWGPRRSPRTSIPIHLRMQPVIDVTPDGRAARFRTRLFSIGSSLNSAGSFSGGMYPNDQAVLEDGVWKLWSVAIDEFYYRSANYKDGWSRVAAEPAEKRPDMLIEAFPPDILLTELGQRQQAFIPGSKQLNPYVHNGPAYPGYPSAVPMWFHYVNPVTGRVPPFYWPDCASCAAHPETSLQANGY
jgi:hypothetical protein